MKFKKCGSITGSASSKKIEKTSKVRSRKKFQYANHKLNVVDQASSSSTEANNYLSNLEERTATKIQVVWVRRSELFIVDSSEANNPKYYCLNEQATPTSLEDQPLFESKQHLLAWKLNCLCFVLRGKGPQRDDEPLQSWVFFFESKQRLLAWKLKRSMAINPFRATFFLRASNAY